MGRFTEPMQGDSPPDRDDHARLPGPRLQQSAHSPGLLWEGRSSTPLRHQGLTGPSLHLLPASRPAGPEHLRTVPLSLHPPGVGGFPLKKIEALLLAAGETEAGQLKSNRDPPAATACDVSPRDQGHSFFSQCDIEDSPSGMYFVGEMSPVWLQISWTSRTVT